MRLCKSTADEIYAYGISEIIDYEISYGYEIYCRILKLGLGRTTHQSFSSPKASHSGQLSGKERWTLPSVTVRAGLMRSLISSLQGIANALLNGQLVPHKGSHN